jgi:hypothetical protein
MLFAACGGDSTGNQVGSGVAVVACTTTSQCSPGSHCGPTGTCIAECGGALTCPGGQSCNVAEGRCISVVGSSGGSTGQPPVGIGSTTGVITTPGGSAGNGGSGGGCAFSNVMFKQETPNVMLIVDRSSSMEKNFGTDTRWNTLRNALIDPTMGFVTTLETQIRFGLQMYTGPIMAGGGFPPPGGGGRMGTGGGSGGGGTPASGGSGGAAANTCPILAGVPIALNNYKAIATEYQAAEPLGNTPTGESIGVIWPQVQALDPVTFPGPRVLVLATDGEPNTCTSITDNRVGRTRSEEEISKAFDAGIQTFVISVGNDVGEDHLRRIANLGQGFPVDDQTERFYPASDPSELADAFSTIINGIRACTFDLNGKVDRNSASAGRVTVDGTQLTYNDPNGWHLNGDGQVVVDGEGCQKIQASAQGIDIWFPCGVFVPE